MYAHVQYMKNIREIKIKLKRKCLKCDTAHTVCSDTQLHSTYPCCQNEKKQRILLRSPAYYHYCFHWSFPTVQHQVWIHVLRNTARCKEKVGRLIDKISQLSWPLCTFKFSLSLCHKMDRMFQCCCCFFFFDTNLRRGSTFVLYWPYIPVKKTHWNSELGNELYM